MRAFCRPCDVGVIPPGLESDSFIVSEIFPPPCGVGNLL